MLEKESGDLERYYRRLLETLGPQEWWPAQTRLEMILGAILTQNTTWRNAALALARLREARVLSLARLRHVSEAGLRSLVRSAGFFRQKARTIAGFLRWLDQAHQGSLGRMFRRPTEQLRRELLTLKGFGPETVDAILLYAGGQPFFVADAYTRRILARHGLVSKRAGYIAVQNFVHQHLRRDPDVYNELHALLVEIGKRYCKRGTPLCRTCPLEDFLPAPTL